jgi:hypothetical protein
MPEGRAQGGQAGSRYGSIGFHPSLKLRAVINMALVPGAVLYSFI